MTLNRVKLGTFMKCLASVSLIYLLKIFIWNKIIFWHQIR